MRLSSRLFLLSLISRSVHEGTKEFAAKCPECGKVFNDRGYLSSHLKIHRDRKEYACPHCPKRFNQRVAYNMHLRIHTGKNYKEKFYRSYLGATFFTLKKETVFNLFVI